MKKYALLLLLLIILVLSCNYASKTTKVKINNDNNKSDYQLVWSDEFNYKGLPDSTKWSYDIEGNKWDWGNNELQNYTAKKEKNAFVDGSKLHIVARKEKFERKEYTSCRLISKNKGDWLYGRFVIRAKLPSGRGIWPAIWMLPTDWAYGNWPKSGEIDIMEHVGYIPDSVFASAHTEKYNHTIGTNKTKGIYLADCETNFHSYILEWEESEYRVFVDSTLYFRFKNEGKTYQEWPFNKRFHLLLNVAVGGNWGGKEGVNDSIFPQEMIIDYVRVYQLKTK